MTALILFHYKDFSLKATGCKKELKVREQVNRIHNFPFLAWSVIPLFLTKSQIFGQSAGISAVFREVCYVYETPREGRGVLGLIFAGYVPLASQNPYSIIVYIITQVILAFWLVLTYDLLENRCTIDVITTKFFSLCFKMAESFENLDNILRDWANNKVEISFIEALNRYEKQKE